MCILLDFFLNSVTSVMDTFKDAVHKLKFKNRQGELRKMQSRLNKRFTENSSKKTTCSPNDFSLRDTLSTLKFWTY